MSQAELQYYEELLRERYRQYLDLLRSGDLVKAGEVLWSITMMLLTMVSLVLRRSPVSSHRTAKEFVRRELADLVQQLLGMDPEEFYQLFHEVEKLHANFYHEFLDEIDLQQTISRAQEFVELLRQLFLKLVEESSV